MRSLRLIPLLAFLWILAACGPDGSTRAIFLVEGDRSARLSGDARTPGDSLAEAGVTLGASDRLLVNGQPSAPDAPLDCELCILQVRRAVPVTLITPGGEQTLVSPAETIGEALADAGISLQAADRIDPPAATPLTAGLIITYAPARDLTVLAGGKPIAIRAAASTVGEALAQAGLAPTGLDYSIPGPASPLPEDGQIRLVRVREQIALAQRSLPYESEFVPSADLELDQQAVLQTGENGLALARTRVRYEDGAETARQTEPESVIRPAQNNIVGYGTRVVIRTATINGETITYWRSVYVWATSYSPCRLGVYPPRCGTLTANRTPVYKGVIAVVRRWFVYMVELPVFIPEYGYATIQDVGGGFDDRYWIDLGWTDAEYTEITTWTTLYFLTPVPDNILYVLPYR